MCAVDDGGQLYVLRLESFGIYNHVGTIRTHVTPIAKITNIDLSMNIFLVG